MTKNGRELETGMRVLCRAAIRQSTGSSREIGRQLNMKPELRIGSQRAQRERHPINGSAKRVHPSALASAHLGVNGMASVNKVILIGNVGAIRK